MITQNTEPLRPDVADRPLLLAAVDDHPYVLKGILWTLRALAPWVTVITTAPTVTELLNGVGGTADVVLLDLDLGLPEADQESDPTHNVQTIRKAGPQVLILTAEERPVPVRAPSKPVLWASSSNPTRKHNSSTRSASPAPANSLSPAGLRTHCSPTPTSSDIWRPASCKSSSYWPRRRPERHRQAPRTARCHLHRRHLSQTRRQHLQIHGAPHL